MTDARGRMLLWTAAFAMLLAGGAMWLNSVSKSKGIAVGMSRRTAEYARLSAMKAEHLAMETAWRAASRKAVTAAPAPLDFAGGLLGGIKPVTQREQRSDLMGKWRLRQQEMTFNDIPVARIAGFVQALEANAPPWRLVHIEIASSQNTGTAARVSLLMETVEPAR